MPFESTSIVFIAILFFIFASLFTIRKYEMKALSTAFPSFTQRSISISIPSIEPFNPSESDGSISSPSITSPLILYWFGLGRNMNDDGILTDDGLNDRRLN